MQGGLSPPLYFHTVQDKKARENKKQSGIMLPNSVALSNSKWNNWFLCSISCISTLGDVSGRDPHGPVQVITSSIRMAPRLCPLSENLNEDPSERGSVRMAPHTCAFSQRTCSWALVPGPTPLGGSRLWLHPPRWVPGHKDSIPRSHLPPSATAGTGRVNQHYGVFSSPFSLSYLFFSPFVFFFFKDEIYLFERQSGGGGKIRYLLPIFFFYLLSGHIRWSWAKEGPESRNSPPGLPWKEQGPKCLGYLLLLIYVHQQAAQLEEAAASITNSD